MPQSDVVVVTIAAAGTTSTAGNIEEMTVTGLIVPTAVSGTLTFSVSADNSTFYTLYDNAGTPAVVTIAAGTHNKAYQAPAALRGWHYVKVVAGAAQTNGLTVTLVGEVQ